MRLPPLRLLILLLLIALFGVAIAAADDWNRETTAVFNQPVQIQGRVLPAGIYVFKLAEISGERNIVQIWNADQTVLEATLLAWPDYVRDAPAENRFILEEQKKGEPAVLRGWFYRGNTHGQTFPYPKKIGSSPNRQ